MPHLTRSHVIAYHENTGLSLPGNLDVTIDDLTKTPEDPCEPRTDHDNIREQPTRCRQADVIDRVVDHSFNTKENTWTYHVRWYDQDDSHDTWESIETLPRNLFVTYHKRVNIPIPNDVSKAVVSLTCSITARHSTRHIW